jgi:hypothetical protein
MASWTRSRGAPSSKLTSAAVRDDEAAAFATTARRMLEPPRSITTMLPCRAIRGAPGDASIASP